MDNLQILWVAKSYTLPDAGIKPHSHPFCHILYVSEGGVAFSAENEKRELAAGQLVLVPKDVCHSYSNARTDICQYLEIKFVPDHATEELLHASGVIWSEDPLAGELMKRITNEYDIKGDASESATRAYLNALLCIITEKFRSPVSRSSRHIDTSGYSELSRRIIGYLEEHYPESVSLDSLSEELDYNKTYLCKAFHDDTGQTIVDCLNMIRIRCAAEMLTYSDQSLSHVAEACGFASVNNFNRVFRKYVGITPGQCRRAYPADIMFSSADAGQQFADRPGRFMRSILAGRNY